MATAEATMNIAEIIELFERYVVPNYRRYPVALARGEGSYVWDAEGNRYLDFFPGWGCNLLGHCPEPVVKAVQEQVATLIHVPNTWYTEAQGRWAKAALGAELRRAGVLLQLGHRGQRGGHQAGPAARAQAAATRSSPSRAASTAARWAPTAATAQPKYHEGLGPLMAGFVYAPFGDLDAVARLIDDETAAIMIEPVQGEGGVNIPPDGLPGRACGRSGRRARAAAGVRRSADRLRPHGRLVRLSALRRHARRDDAGQGPVRRHRRRGAADHGRDRPQPAARHARGHVRRQSDRRPGRHRGHRDDRAREPAGATPSSWARCSASGSTAWQASATWSARCACWA